ncbi:hypothetical protein [Frankia sp. Cr1]|uniref:hypothetical protein n=1 Tax=Frankia sp. Cr1 TaxID=3073931 RepID=UPI002AD2F03D|nr:hypothetical protein [Frankia sp. Cr1]
MTRPTDAPGSTGRMPAAGRHPHLDPSLSSAVRRSGVGLGVVAGVGREPVISAVDSAPSPHLPVRVPYTSWPGHGAVVRSRGRVVRPVAERTWSVVVLDAEGDPVETVTGFSSLDAVDAYAELSPDITRWTSVPSRYPGSQSRDLKRGPSCPHAARPPPRPRPRDQLSRAGWPRSSPAPVLTRSAGAGDPDQEGQLVHVPARALPVTSWCSASTVTPEAVDVVQIACGVHWAFIRSSLSQSIPITPDALKDFLRAAKAGEFDDIISS